MNRNGQDTILFQNKTHGSTGNVSEHILGSPAGFERLVFRIIFSLCDC